MHTETATKNTVMKTIVAKNLKILRGKAGYSQKEVADFLGIERGAYANFETDSSRLMSIDKLERICELYGISLKSLFNENLQTDEFVCAFRISSLNQNDIAVIANFKKVVRNYLQFCTYND